MQWDGFLAFSSSRHNLLFTDCLYFKLSRFITSCFYTYLNCLLFASSFFFFKPGYCFLVCNHIGVNILWLIDIIFQTRYILSLFRKLVGFQCTCVGPVVFLLSTFLLFFFFYRCHQSSVRRGTWNVSQGMTQIGTHLQHSKQEIFEMICSVTSVTTVRKLS